MTTACVTQIHSEKGQNVDAEKQKIICDHAARGSLANFFFPNSNSPPVVWATSTVAESAGYWTAALR